MELVGIFEVHAQSKDTLTVIISITDSDTLKSETFLYSEEDEARSGMKLDLRFHGTKGPLKKKMPQKLDDVTLPWFESAKALGIPSNPDPVCFLTWPHASYFVLASQ
jgi:hypothetical protein